MPARQRSAADLLLSLYLSVCLLHPQRYMEQHDCSYDIKSLHRKKLKKENEEIRAAKIVKL
jgi:hypothetical protein